MLHCRNTVVFYLLLLVKHIKDMESTMYGLTKQDVLSLAYQLAEKHKITHPFSAKREMPDVKGVVEMRPKVEGRTQMLMG